MPLKFTKLLFLLFLTTEVFSQNTLVAELSGNPIDIQGWTLISNSPVTDEIVLTENELWESGSVYFSQPYNLNKCKKWRVEFDFRLFDGNVPVLGPGDGMAFWFLSNPPTDFATGGGLGIPSNSNGLKVCFDTFDNFNFAPNPEIQVYYGVGYDENFNNMLTQYAPNLRSNNYQKAEILWDNGFITVKINDTTLLSGTPIPQNGVENITNGYFGFSASTGGATDKHSIKNVKVFIDTMDTQNAQIVEPCDVFSNGTAVFDLTSVENQIATADYFSYHLSISDASLGTNAISNPDSFTNTTPYNQTVYVRVEDQGGCYNTAEIALSVLSGISVNNAEIALCDENENGIQIFDLTSVENQIAQQGAFSYYLSENEAENLQNAISNPDVFENTIPYEQEIFVRIQQNQQCHKIAKIQLKILEQPYVEIRTPKEISCGKSVWLNAENSSIGQDFYAVWTSDNLDFTPVENQYFIEVNQGGTYTFTQTNLLTGCQSSQSVFVVENPNPNPHNLPLQGVSVDVTGAYFQNQNIIVSVAQQGNYTYQLNDGTIQSSPVFTNVPHGLYTVSIYDVENCRQAQIAVRVIGYPKFFTPNGDGFNDYWHITRLENSIVYIFDRYGKLLETLAPNDAGWDGTYNGNLLPATDYWFVVNYQEDGIQKTFKAHFSLKR